MILRSAALGGVVLPLENNSICHMLYLMSADCPSKFSQPHKIRVIGLNWARREKPVFGVSDKVSFKPVSSATETS